ncbi:hypothetical protein ACFY3G_17755 [Streptomyces phaeochromogenes]|uniref:hypothetical protein n=1 Tax=Streptomyces phaeochromogenes TaxID=1923 RepID=UPI003688344C
MKTPSGHRQVIEAALYDWWLNTDPSEPFHAPDVAAQVEMYLRSSGYVIAPDTREAAVPRRQTIVGTVAVALACAAAAVAGAIVHDWGWASLGTVGAAIATGEAAIGMRDRRRGVRR